MKLVSVCGVGVSEAMYLSSCFLNFELIKKIAYCSTYYYFRIAAYILFLEYALDTEFV